MCALSYAGVRERRGELPNHSFQGDTGAKSQVGAKLLADWTIGEAVVALVHDLVSAKQRQGDPADSYHICIGYTRINTKGGSAGEK